LIIARLKNYLILWIKPIWIRKSINKRNKKIDIIIIQAVFWSLFAFLNARKNPIPKLNTPKRPSKKRNSIRIKTTKTSNKPIISIYHLNNIF
jgi:hypothetical protein